MNIGNNLNEIQEIAVHHGTGPLLILAGAGSGKTRVITHRIAHLIRECGVSPYRILAITFTNKAAKEMQERVAGLLDVSEGDVWISTFHSACVRILRRFCTSIGFSANFVIYDTDDQKRAMRDVLKRLNIDPKKLPPKTVLSIISSAKNELVGPDTFRDVYGRSVDADVARAYEAYQEDLRKNNAFDFDDLLMKTVELLETDNDALSYYQDRYEYILVDEYQDTNTAQFRMIQLLATHINDAGEPEHNLCVVGDDDQSIYRFRGANIRNILDFEKSYPDAKVIRLEQNYRSTTRILDCANAVISHNRGRKVKKLWSENEPGDLIRVTEYPSDLDEAKAVVREIAGSVREGNSTYRDHAILYRTNAQSRAFEEQLVVRGIPYKLVGGTNFYERMEVRDILAYLRTVDSGDAMSVKRIINVPRRGIGDTTIDKVDEYAYIKDISFFGALRAADTIPGLSSRTAGLIGRFVALVDELRNLLKAPDYRLTKLVDDILEMTGYENDLKEQDPESFDDRMENVRELKSKIAQYESAAEDPDLSGFLAEVALVADIDAVDENEDYVVLMTLHSAKGLEFDHVYIGGMEEGLFPSRMALDADGESRTDENLEEERRLCYVGITRARKTLALSYTAKRMVRGELQFNAPSRFLAELPRELIKKRTETSSDDSGWAGRNSMRRGSLDSFRSGSKPGYGSGGSYSSKSGYGSDDSYGSKSGYGSGSSYGSKSGKSFGSMSDILDYMSDSGYGTPRRNSASTSPSSAASTQGTGRYVSPYGTSRSGGAGSAVGSFGSSAGKAVSGGAPDYQVGDRVRHVKFGVGTVTEITPGSTDYHVTVNFPAGVKQMLASFAKLVKVDD